MLPCLSKMNKTECTFLKDKTRTELYLTSSLFDKFLDAFPQEVNPYVK